MNPLRSPDINIIVVPRAISDNFSSIGVKKLLTPNYLETILSPSDILFYKFLNSLNFTPQKPLEIVKKFGIQSFTLDELTTIYKAFIFQYGNNNDSGDFAKAMHRLVFERQEQYGHFLRFTILAREDNTVVLGLTSSPETETVYPVVKTVVDIITTFYEHYGLQALTQGYNFPYLRSLVFTAI